MKEEINKITEEIISLLRNINYQLSNMIDDEKLSPENKEWKKELVEDRYKLSECLVILLN